MIRGTIGLIPSRSGTVAGSCDVIDCVGPLSAEVFRENAAKAGMTASEATLGHYRKTYAWVLANPRLFTKPVLYKHPSGAVIWVNLDSGVQQAVLKLVRR